MAARWRLVAVCTVAVLLSPWWWMVVPYGLVLGVPAGVVIDLIVGGVNGDLRRQLRYGVAWWVALAVLVNFVSGLLLMGVVGLALILSGK